MTTTEARPRHVWLDADGPPRAILDVLVRASRNREVPMTFVANRFIAKPNAALIQTVTVRQGADAADDYIAERCQPGDLVITADIPLAARAVDAGALVLHPRGGMLSADNVRERLAMRDLKEGLREIGVMTGGPPPFGTKERQQFANALDRWLARVRRR